MFDFRNGKQKCWNKFEKLKIKKVTLFEISKIITMVRSTLLFLFLQKFWRTLKSVQDPPTFGVFSCLQCWIWKLFCRPLSISFRYILAMITIFNFTDSISKIIMKICSTLAEMWKNKRSHLSIFRNLRKIALKSSETTCLDVLGTWK